jgi:disulfide bond formation protein DsbB
VTAAQPDLRAGGLAWAPLLVLVAAVAIPGAALVSQFGFGLEPCELCLWQRWPYLAAFLFGLGALASRGRIRGLFLALAALSFAATAGIGVFHVGVEQHWWAGLPSCSGGSTPATVEALRAQLLGKPVVRCDDIAFEFLGISMAGWNVLAAGALALFSLRGALLLVRR